MSELTYDISNCTLLRQTTKLLRKQVQLCSKEVNRVFKNEKSNINCHSKHRCLLRKSRSLSAMIFRRSKYRKRKKCKIVAKNKSKYIYIDIMLQLNRLITNNL